MPPWTLVEGMDMPPVDPKKVPWTIWMARGISRIARNLETKLLSKLLLTLYCEWCSVPRPSSKGVAYIDAAFVYDAPSDDIPMTRTTHIGERKIFTSACHIACSVQATRWRLPSEESMTFTPKPSGPT